MAAWCNHPKSLDLKNLAQSLGLYLCRAPLSKGFLPLLPQVHLGDTPNSLADADFMALGEQTEGYSGSDISVVVKDVLMQPIRTLREATHFHCYRNEAGAEVWEPCPPPGLHAPPDPSVREYTLEALAMQHGADKVVAPRITRRDFDKVLTRARPTVSPSDLDVFVKFTHEFGEDG